MIKINISKAKEVKKEHLREERKALLAKLDVDFMKALELGDAQKQQEIVQEKQRLRDITLLADSCETVEELKALNCGN